jgi:hypothetical protein
LVKILVKPKQYYREKVNGVVRERLGGYLVNDELFTDHIMIPQWRIKENSYIKDKNIIYDLINNINSVGYKINTDVLEFVNNFGVKYNLVQDPNF